MRLIGFSPSRSLRNSSPKDCPKVATQTGLDGIPVAQSPDLNSSSLMPINVKSMLLNGVSDKEVTKNWLNSIKCEDYLSNFIDNGYDMPTIARMTPQDLTAIGCKSPVVRKKLLLEIKKLNIELDVPELRPDSLEKWLHLLKLIEYYPRLCSEGYDTIDKVCKLTWEDLEEIGVVKLGHQKRLLLGIDKLNKHAKYLEDQQNECIYDVHPNYRISLHNKNNPEGRLSTLSRSTSRSGFFQTRSGANLDHRGLPVATVMPALKHINAPVSPESKQLDNSSQISKDDASNTSPNNSNSNNTNDINNNNNNRLSTSSVYGMHKKQSTTDKPRSLNDFCTLKRVPPPLPPMRTNSLKIANNGQDNDNCIYGNTGGTFANNQSINASTSFVRSPKIGVLTATTNKMLTLGGHIRPINGTSTTMRSIVPLREAPAPPSTQIYDKIDEESGLQMHSFASPLNLSDSQSLINNSSISHQLAGADEFPPPPPAQ